MIRRRDHDGVNVLALQDPARISRAERRLGLLRVQSFGINVAQRHQSHAVQLAEVRDVTFAFVAEADDCHANVVVRAENAKSRQRQCSG